MEWGSFRWVVLSSPDFHFLLFWFISIAVVIVYIPLGSSITIATEESQFEIQDVNSDKYEWMKSWVPQHHRPIPRTVVVCCRRLSAPHSLAPFPDLYWGYKCIDKFCTYFYDATRINTTTLKTLELTHSHTHSQTQIHRARVNNMKSSSSP